MAWKGRVAAARGLRDASGKSFIFTNWSGSAERCDLCCADIGHTGLRLVALTGLGQSSGQDALLLTWLATFVATRVPDPPVARVVGTSVQSPSAMEPFKSLYLNAVMLR